VGEVIHIAEWLNRRDPEAIKKRLADIALEKLLLQSEANRLTHQLQIINNEQKTKD